MLARPAALLALTLALIACLVPAANAADDDAAAVLYDPSKVTTVDLSMSEAAIQSLRDAPKTYVDAGVTLTTPTGTKVGPYAIGVKLKGNFTLRPIEGKPSFKFKFAHSVKGQKVLGLKGMTLNNMFSDQSFIHETLTYSIFRAGGVPAPRTGYAYVRLNGQPKGLYLDLEPYDTVSLARLFPGGTQHLYEGESSADVAPNKRGQFGVDEGDEKTESDLDALINAANRTAGDWSDGMAATANLDAMTRMWAGESFVAHWDGYSVFAQWYSPNNYYLHSLPNGVFTMLPGGVDQTLSTWRRPIGEGAGILFTRCLADASCKEQYRTALRTFSSAAYGMGLAKQAETATATVARWRSCADVEQPAADKWRWETEDVHIFLKQRRQEVSTYLKDTGPSPRPIETPATIPAQSTQPCPAPPVAGSPIPPDPTPTPAPTATAPATEQPTPGPSGDVPATTPVPGGGVASDVTTTPAPKRCVVPKRLRGRTLTTTRKRLRGANCRIVVVRKGDGQRVKAGGWRVKTTRPGAGARREPGARILVLLVPKR